MHGIKEIFVLKAIIDWLYHFFFLLEQTNDFCLFVEWFCLLSHSNQCFIIINRINFLFDSVEKLFVINWIGFKNLSCKVLLLVVDCMQEYMVLSCAGQYLISHQQLCERCYEVFRTSFIEGKSLNIKIVLDKGIREHWNIFKLEKDAMVAKISSLVLVLASWYEACVE